MNIPDDLQYTPTHEWVRLEGASARIGITPYDPANAACSMRVELPSVGDQVKAGDPVVKVIFVDATEEIIAPLSGTVTEINFALSNHPQLIHTDPYGDGWIFRLKMEAGEEIEHLIEASRYRKTFGDSEGVSI